MDGIMIGEVNSRRQHTAAAARFPSCHYADPQTAPDTDQHGRFTAKWPGWAFHEEIWFELSPSRRQTSQIDF